MFKIIYTKNLLSQHMRFHSASAIVKKHSSSNYRFSFDQSNLQIFILLKRKDFFD